MYTIYAKCPKFYIFVFVHCLQIFMKKSLVVVNLLQIMTQMKPQGIVFIQYCYSKNAAMLHVQVALYMFENVYIAGFYTCGNHRI